MLSWDIHRPRFIQIDKPRDTLPSFVLFYFLFFLDHFVEGVVGEVYLFKELKCMGHLSGILDFCLYLLHSNTKCISSLNYVLDIQPNMRRFGESFLYFLYSIKYLG